MWKMCVYGCKRLTTLFSFFVSSSLIPASSLVSRDVVLSFSTFLTYLEVVTGCDHERFARGVVLDHNFFLSCFLSYTKVGVVDGLFMRVSLE